MSSRVNKAYKTLLNPYTRAEYLLQQEGLEIGESDNVQDKELIMEILELREALEEAEDQEAVDEIRAENAGMRCNFCPQEGQTHGSIAQTILSQ